MGTECCCLRFLSNEISPCPEERTIFGKRWRLNYDGESWQCVDRVVYALEFVSFVRCGDFR